MNNKTVGIIISSYNQGQFLETTILSALENKKNANVKIAVVDGGSTDNSTDIIKKYCNNLDYWCSEYDGGQSAGLNKGIQALCHCDYYMCLNSDDVYENDHSVSDILAFVIENNFQVAYGLSRFIDIKGKSIGEFPTEEYNPIRLADNCYLSFPSVIFSHEAYIKCGGFNESLQMCLDYEYWIRLSKLYDFGYFNKYISAARIHGESKTSTMHELHLNEGICILQKYYGDVPMHWVVDLVLCRQKISSVPDIVLKVLSIILIPYKGKVVKDCLAKNKY